MKIQNKTLFAVTRNDGKYYVLLETLSKLFFPKVSVDEFAHALQNVLLASVVTCTAEEEKLFVDAYKDVSINCTKAIQADSFEECCGPLTYIFKTDNSPTQQNNAQENESQHDQAQQSESQQNHAQQSEGQQKKTQQNDSLLNKVLLDVAGQRKAENDDSCRKRKREKVNSYLVKQLKICLVDVVKEKLCHDICNRYRVKFRE